MLRTNLLTFFVLLLTFIIPQAMAKDLNLTIVYDNNPYNENLETRWGFSCLLEGTEKTILFDVGGEGKVLLENMKKLKINPEDVDIIVLSHIHQDHIGGLSDFLGKNSDVTVYLPESFPKKFKKDIKKKGAQLKEIKRPAKICENVISTGELGKTIKEQSLIVKTTKGSVVITGCAHPGVVNIVETAKEIGKSDVFLVLGGFHLLSMKESQIKEIANQIRNLKVKKIAPCHCSGDLAREIFEKEYKEDFIQAGVGKEIKIENAFVEKENIKR